MELKKRREKPKPTFIDVCKRYFTEGKVINSSNLIDIKVSNFTIPKEFRFEELPNNDVMIHCKYTHKEILFSSRSYVIYSKGQFAKIM